MKRPQQPQSVTGALSSSQLLQYCNKENQITRAVSSAEQQPSLKQRFNQKRQQSVSQTLPESLNSSSNKKKTTTTTVITETKIATTTKIVVRQSSEITPSSPSTASSMGKPKVRPKPSVVPPPQLPLSQLKRQQSLNLQKWKKKPNSKSQ